MDEDEHHKEIYAFFGLSMYMAQALEHGIVNALVFCDLIPNKRANANSKDEWGIEVDQFMDGHFENTMARLMNSFRKAILVSDELEQLFQKSLKMRNFLAHRYLENEP